jgi:hypothetical protein
MQNQDKPVDLRAAVCEALAGRGLSAHSVALSAKVDPAILRPYLAGKSRLRSDKLERVLGVLGVEVRVPGREVSR